MEPHRKSSEQHRSDAARILFAMPFASKPKTIFGKCFINTLLRTNNDEIFSQAELEEIRDKCHRKWFA